jgi:hypothetical protein
MKFYCSSLVEWSYRQALNASAGSGVLCPADFDLLFVPLAYWEV